MSETDSAIGRVPHDWPVVPLGTVAQERDELLADREPPTVMAVTKHEGMIPSEEYFQGRQIFSRDLSRYKLVRRNNFAYSTIHIDEGAIAVLRNADEVIVSPMYTVFELDSKVNVDFFWYLLKSPSMVRVYGRLGQGSINRRRSVSFGTLAEVQIPLPPLPEQRKIATILRSVDETLARTETIIAKLNAIKQQIIEQFLGSGIYEQRQLNEILTLVKRPVEVDPQAAYREIGIRSHGKGIFHKAPVLGADFRKKAVYYIEPGDFVLNIVFAWEGAVALASEVERGMVGSHRFPTFIVNTEICQPKYLLWSFKTAQGKHQLGLVSPGGAGRNKTLNRSKFLRLSIPLPPLTEQIKIVETLESIDQRIETEQAYRSNLERVKQGLMQKLLSGEIRVTV